MVRGFSRIAAVRLEANSRDPKEEVYSRKSAFDPRESASRLSRVVIPERRALAGDDSIPPPAARRRPTAAPVAVAAELHPVAR